VVNAVHSGRDEKQVMDGWSRRVVGWAVHEHEIATHAAALIQRIRSDSGIDPTGLAANQNEQ
jgi:transposase InsO family protein